MIMVAAFAGAENVPNGSWEANLTRPLPGRLRAGQLPSNRHNYKTDIAFCDGHSERPLRNDVISPPPATVANAMEQRNNLTLMQVDNAFDSKSGLSTGSVLLSRNHAFRKRERTARACKWSAPLPTTQRPESTSTGEGALLPISN